MFSDLHCGYVKSKAELLARVLGKLKGVDAVVMLGDILDLWRADPVDALYHSSPVLEALIESGAELIYVVGNHDYHSWACRERLKSRGLITMEVYHPFYFLDGVLYTHGHLFDVWKHGVPEQAAYAIYEAIYKMGEKSVAILEHVAYRPLVLLLHVLRGLRWWNTAPRWSIFERALAEALREMSKEERSKAEQGLRELSEDLSMLADLVAPADSRLQAASAARELASRLETKPIHLDTVANLRARAPPMPSQELLELASRKAGVEARALVYGHTHEAYADEENNVYNVGCWVKEPCHYALVEDGRVKLEKA